MIIRLVRHFNTKRTLKSASLGRWGGILQEDSNHKNIENIIEKNIFSGNHDHCGSEICALPSNSEPNINTVKIDFTIYANDPYWPFLL
jgi:hypothetical protein